MSAPTDLRDEWHPAIRHATDRISRVQPWVWVIDVAALTALLIALDHWYSFLLASLVVLIGTAFLLLASCVAFWLVVAYRFPVDDEDDGEDYEVQP